MIEESPRSFREFIGLLEADLQISLGQSSPETLLVEDLMLDSVSIFELFVLVEEFIGRILPEELLDSVQTLGDAYGWYLELQDSSES